MKSGSLDKFVLRPARQQVWGKWQAMSFSMTGIGSGFYVVITGLWGLGREGVPPPIQWLGIGLVFAGALALFIMDLTYRSVFLRYLLSNLGSAWISRGGLAFFVFGAFSVAAYGVGKFTPWPTGVALGLAIVASGVAVLIMTYPGLVLAASPIPFWRSALVPLGFLSTDLAGGLALLLLLRSVWGWPASIEGPRIALLALLVLSGALTLAHLIRTPRNVRRETLALLTRGDLMSFFVVGFMSFGLLLPLLLVVGTYYFSGFAVSWALFLVGILVVQGIVVNRYCLLKAGIRPALL